MMTSLLRHMQRVSAPKRPLTDLYHYINKTMQIYELLVADCLATCKKLTVVDEIACH